MAVKFKWDLWDFDCEGEAYVIGKHVCTEIENVPDFIVNEDCLHLDCKGGMVVEEGVCKYQVRTDWENGDGEPEGGYYVIRGKKNTDGMRGWFPVWIVRKGEWY
jgi:hypothetical protein